MNKCIIKCTFNIKSVDDKIRILGDEFKSFDSNNCEIYIDNELIPFTKKCKFKRTGIINVNYALKNNINNNIKDMGGMFSGCSNLSTISFPSSFNTQNVTYMGDMFSGCSKLSRDIINKINTK